MNQNRLDVVDMHAQLVVSAFLVLILAGLSSCTAYLPGRQSYWDEQIREMCAKDGGVVVYERVKLTHEEFKRLGGLERALPLPTESNSTSAHPYFRRVVDTRIHTADPEVMRSETQVIRRSDGKVLGRSVRYWRRGGDIPTGIAHESSYICPASAELTPQIFIVSARSND
jgi:hypothetical protein